MKITIELLKNMPSGTKACEEAQEWFRKNFPNGGELWNVWDVCSENDWLIWFTCHYVGSDKRQELAYKFAGQTFRYTAIQCPELKEYADNINSGNVKIARSAAEAANAAYSTNATAAIAANTAANTAAIAANATYDATYDATSAIAAIAYDAYDDYDAAYDAACDARQEQAEWCKEVMLNEVR